MVQSKQIQAMTPKEKAEELYDKFIHVPFAEFDTTNKDHAKQCALISLEQERISIAKSYQHVTSLERVMDKESWIATRVFLENLGIENEQTKIQVESL